MARTDMAWRWLEDRRPTAEDDLTGGTGEMMFPQYGNPGLPPLPPQVPYTPPQIPESHSWGDTLAEMFSANPMRFHGNAGARGAAPAMAAVMLANLFAQRHRGKMQDQRDLNESLRAQARDRNQGQMREAERERTRRDAWIDRVREAGLKQRQETAEENRKRLEKEAEARQYVVTKELKPYVTSSFAVGDILPPNIYSIAYQRMLSQKFKEAEKPPKPAKPPQYSGSDYRREAVGAIPDLISSVKADKRFAFGSSGKALGDSLNALVGRRDRAQTYGQRIWAARSVAELETIAREYMTDADLSKQPGVISNLNRLIDQREQELGSNP